MAAPHYNEQASIEYKSVEMNPSFGTEVVTWMRLALVWVEVYDLLPSRSESVRQGLATARNQVRIRMRYRPDVTSDMRIVVHGGGVDTVYEIVGGPAVLGRREALEMVCERWTS